MENERTTKEQLTHVLLEVLNIAGHEVQHSNCFEKAYQKRLKFQNREDWKKYRSCIDLIEDSELAIINIFQFKLGNNIGEMYLRLYGVLNAVYLQINAYKTLSFLINYHKRDSVKPSFEKLEIYKLRNIAASHTTDYEDQRGKNSFRIIRISITKDGKIIQALDKYDKLYEFNLIKILGEYELHARQLLIDLIKHVQKTLLLNREDKEWVQERLDFVVPRLINYSSL